MALYFSDESKRERECDYCGGRGEWSISTDGIEICRNCHGTGKLGDPRARPDLSVNRYSDSWHASQFKGKGWYYNCIGLDRIMGPREGPYPTEQAALAAAREAVSEGD